MSFFLLGKGPDGHLTLISENALATRQEALAELSRVTADPAFSNWDDEVVVMDLDTGTPVLLVRPAAAGESADEVTEESADAEPAPDEESAAEGSDADVEVDAADEQPGDTELGEDASVIEAPAAADEPSEDAETAEEPVAEVDAAWAEAVAETAEDEDEELSLREALERTAEQMEAEGITAPESIGPAESSEETSGEAEAEPPAWPWDTAATEPAAETAAEPAEFVLDALEEPGLDDAGLVRAPGDDETMEAAKPVILGAYGESEAASGADAGHEAPMAPEEPAAEDVPEVAADDVAAEPEEPLVADEGAGEPDTVSDFILDLEPAPPGYELSASAQPQMSCLDCVYERTCPHKDVGPPDCGSFQWK